MLQSHVERISWGARLGLINVGEASSTKGSDVKKTEIPNDLSVTSLKMHPMPSVRYIIIIMLSFFPNFISHFQTFLSFKHTQKKNRIFYTRLYTATKGIRTFLPWNLKALGVHSSTKIDISVNSKN